MKITERDELFDHFRLARKGLDGYAETFLDYRPIAKITAFKARLLELMADLEDFEREFDK